MIKEKLLKKCICCGDPILQVNIKKETCIAYCTMYLMGRASLSEHNEIVYNFNRYDNQSSINSVILKTLNGWNNVTENM